MKDRPALLAQTVETVLGQVGVEVHLVVVEDGGASRAADSLPDDRRIRVVRHDG